MMSTGEVAKLLGVSSQSVINWLEMGRLPYQRIGRGPRKVKEVDLLRFLREQGISTDTLDQKMFEQLQRSLSQESSSDAFVPVLVLINRDGLVVSWNEGAVRLFGIASQDVLLKPLSWFPAKVEGSQNSLEYTVLSQWRAPFVEWDLVHPLGSERLLKTHVVVSRYYGRTTSAGGFALVFSARE